MSWLSHNFRSQLLKTFDVATRIMKWAIIAHVTVEHVASIGICDGESMEPFLRTGDVLITEQITPRFGEINRGDIIVARSPRKPQEHICKRVVGISGDPVVCSIFDRHGISVPFIPKGHIWVEGDNKRNSTDSRDYGPIPLGLVKGRVLFKIWPLRFTRTSDPGTGKSH